MVLCWHCGANLPEQANYCRQCGKELKGHLSVSPPSFSDTPTKSYERDSEQTERRIREHEKATPVLLSPERRKQVLELWHDGKYDQLDTFRRELAREVQYSAANALPRILFDQAFDTLLPPYGSFGKSEPEEFPHVKEFLSKEDAASREKGLERLRRLKANNAFKLHPLVEDWRLYAAALVHGLGYSVPKWQEKYKQGKASNEDIWNLAVFYARQSDYKQALDVLRTGFDAPGLNKNTFPLRNCALPSTVQRSSQARSQKQVTPRPLFSEAISTNIQSQSVFSFGCC